MSASALTLPLEGGLDLASLGGGSGPLVFTISGTLSSSLDGSEIDVFSRTAGGETLESEPFVTLPAGTKLLSADRVAHRYTFEAPRSASMPIAFRADLLAGRRLVTVSEARDSLTGALVIEARVPPPSLPVAAAAEVSRAPEMFGLLGVSGGLLVAALGLSLRRRQRPELVLERRAERIALRVNAEARALGTLFARVPESTGALVRAVSALRVEVERAESAVRKIGSSANAIADARRVELEKRREDALARMRGLVQRLDEVAAELATHDATSTKPAAGVEEALGGLDRDVRAAVRADTELRAIG